MSIQIKKKRNKDGQWEISVSQSQVEVTTHVGGSAVSKIRLEDWIKLLFENESEAVRLLAEESLKSYDKWGTDPKKLWIMYQTGHLDHKRFCLMSNKELIETAAAFFEWDPEPDYDDDEEEIKPKYRLWADFEREHLLGTYDTYEEAIENMDCRIHDANIEVVS